MRTSATRQRSFSRNAHQALQVLPAGHFESEIPAAIGPGVETPKESFAVSAGATRNKWVTCWLLEESSMISADSTFDSSSSSSAYGSGGAKCADSLAAGRAV